MRKRLIGGKLNQSCENRALLYLLANIFRNLGTDSNNNLIYEGADFNYYFTDTNKAHGKFGKDVENAVFEHVKKYTGVTDMRNMQSLTNYLKKEAAMIEYWTEADAGCNIRNMEQEPETQPQNDNSRLNNYLKLIKELAIIIPIDTVQEDQDLLDIINKIKKNHNNQSENPPPLNV